MKHFLLIILLALNSAMMIATEPISSSRRGTGLEKETAAATISSTARQDLQQSRPLEENDGNQDFPVNPNLSSGQERGWTTEIADASTTTIDEQSSAVDPNVTASSITKNNETREVETSTTSNSDDEQFGEFEQEFNKEGVTSTQKVFDPLSGYNRVMFKINDKFYFWVLKPMSKGYNFLVPQFMRSSIDRAFQNLLFPQRFVSSLLQLKMKKTATELGRFVVNSSIGLGGLMDPAGRYLKWHSSKEDLGQVLAFYGVGDGFPIVLPLLGQTNLRDGIAMVPSSWFNPMYVIADFNTLLAIRSSERFNFVSLHLGEYESLKKDALDPYAFFRDAYKQRRDREIKE